MFSSLYNENFDRFKLEYKHYERDIFFLLIMHFDVKNIFKPVLSMKCIVYNLFVAQEYRSFTTGIMMRVASRIQSWLSLSRCRSMSSAEAFFSITYRSFREKQRKTNPRVYFLLKANFNIE